MCNNLDRKGFVDIGTPGRIWAVPALHGDIEKLISLHDRILEEFKVTDKLVYLGNYTGYNTNSVACIDEILTFRRLLLSLPGMRCSDIIYLRGTQEEMWQKLLQLPFAPDPTNILLWMLGNGLSATLTSYGICYHDGIEACRAGVMAITKWVNSIRQTVRKHAGHETFSNALVRAAHTQENGQYPILFVNAGLNAERPLDHQGDNFWWASSNFENIERPYLPFQKVVRGYDPRHKGVHLNCVTATIDGGCGFGGQLVAALFEKNEQTCRMIEA